jgi:hypothetical protein
VRRAAPESGCRTLRAALGLEDHHYSPADATCGTCEPKVRGLSAFPASRTVRGECLRFADGQAHRHPVQRISTAALAAAAASTHEGRSSDRPFRCPACRSIPP